MHVGTTCGQPRVPAGVTAVGVRGEVSGLLATQGGDSDQPQGGGNT